MVKVTRVKDQEAVLKRTGKKITVIGSQGALLSARIDGEEKQIVPESVTFISPDPVELRKLQKSIQEATASRLSAVQARRRKEPTFTERGARASLLPELRGVPASFQVSQEFDVTGRPAFIPDIVPLASARGGGVAGIQRKEFARIQREAREAQKERAVISRLVQEPALLPAQFLSDIDPFAIRTIGEAGFGSIIFRKTPKETAASIIGIRKEFVKRAVKRAKERKSPQEEFVRGAFEFAEPAAFIFGGAGIAATGRLGATIVRGGFAGVAGFQAAEAIRKPTPATVGLATVAIIGFGAGEIAGIRGIVKPPKIQKFQVEKVIGVVTETGKGKILRQKELVVVPEVEPATIAKTKDVDLIVSREFLKAAAKEPKSVFRVREVEREGIIARKSEIVNVEVVTAKSIELKPPKLEPFVKLKGQKKELRIISQDLGTRADIKVGAEVLFPVKQPKPPSFTRPLKPFPIKKTPLSKTFARQKIQEKVDIVDKKIGGVTKLVGKPSGLLGEISLPKAFAPQAISFEPISVPAARIESFRTLVDFPKAREIVSPLKVSVPDTRQVIFSRLSVRPSVRERPIISAFEKIRPVDVAFEAIPRQRPIQKPKALVRQDIIFKQEEIPRITTRITPRRRVARRRLPPIIPTLEIDDIIFRPKRARKPVKLKRKTRFVPSLTAVELGIVSSDFSQEIFTGLEIRPVRRKKKKRKR